MVTWANPAFSQLTGYSLEETRGRKTNLLKSGQHDQAFYRHLWETIIAGRVWHAEMVNRRKDGSLYTEDCTITPVRDERGVIAHFIAVKQDVTAHKQSKRALLESEQRFAVFMDHLPLAAFIKDQAGHALFANKYLQDTFGWKEWAGKSTLELLPSEVAKRMADDDAKALAQSLLVVEETVTDVHGRERTFETYKFPIRPEVGPVLLGGVAVDITERKLLETQLRQAQKMEAIGQLAGGIAHDLNNILTPILVSVGMLRERMAKPDDRRVVAIIEASAKRGADIVRQLLWFGRGLEGRRILLNPKYVMKDVARFVSETFDKSIRLQTNIVPDVWPIMVDPTLLHQVLLNLCLNARDAMPAGGQLSFAGYNVTVDEKGAAASPAAKPGPYVVLEVRDTGTGIPPEIRARIFEPFFTTKEPGKGTGLGLSTVMSIVKGYGGFIDVVSQPGQGTAFRVHLPAEPNLSAGQPVAEQAESPPRGHGETILVVDDEDSVCLVVQRTLENFGYHVLTACDGERALTTYVGHQATVAVVLTDLMMPVMDGAATIRALKHINPQVKVIAGSGLGSHPKLDALRSLGVEHFITKPYTAETLLKKLREVLAEESVRTP